MIIVKGDRADYAIIKQIQQLLLAQPHHSVAAYDSADLSTLGNAETLYVIGHGDSPTGNLREISRDALITWFTTPPKGLPNDYAGTIVLLSCYSGQQRFEQPRALGQHVAEGLAKVGLHPHAVRGANGWSFGTPEFGVSGLSSVLATDLRGFYNFEGLHSTFKQWLNLTPTHPGGVLSAPDEQADTRRTVADNIRHLRKYSGAAPDHVASDIVQSFFETAPAIEKRLKQISESLPGATAIDQARYLVDHPADPTVTGWNRLINEQFDLYGNHYLWMPNANAFTDFRA